jgi:hypothetical protein
MPPTIDVVVSNPTGDTKLPTNIGEVCIPVVRIIVC